MFIRLFIVTLIAVLSGCANFNTISRSTLLGAAGTPSGIKSSTAIHLDAQQRVVLSKDNMEKVCAEPSPDAMAAYASALAVGVNIPSMGAGSLSHGSQDTLANIGLRTQSITLMRDALYRVCEAYMNGAIGEVYSSTLLGRGMDLTAVVLAVEQLTGAVKASQSILTGSTDTSSSATGSEMLNANTEALTQATELRDKQEKELNELKGKLPVKSQEVTAQQSVFNTIKSTYDSGIQSGNLTDKTKGEFEAEKKKLEKLQSEESQLKQDVDTKEKLYQFAKENVKAIEKTRDSTLTQMNAQAIAKTSSSGEFDHVTINNLHSNSQHNIDEIAKAVKEMVSHALDKDYSIESCLAYLGSELGSRKNLDLDIKNNCIRIIEFNISLQKQKLTERQSLFNKQLQ